MVNPDLLNLSLKDIVTQDFHAAAVFEKYTLDFCCHGGKTIVEACHEKGIEAASVLGELETLGSNSGELFPRFDNWGVDFLIDYIVKNQHAFVSKMIPVLLVH